MVLGADAEIAKQPRTLAEPPEGRQAHQQRGGALHEPVHHVPVAEMAELVRHHGRHLLGGGPADQRVEQHDPLGASEADEEGIAVRGAA